MVFNLEHRDLCRGAKDDRPGLKTCLAYLKEGDGLVVWKLDRLGRSLPHLLSIVTDLRERRGRRGGRPPAIDPEQMEQITAALDAGASKTSVCRTFKVARSTLIDTLKRMGWTSSEKT